MHIAPAEAMHACRAHHFEQELPFVTLHNCRFMHDQLLDFEALSHLPGQMV